MVRKKIRAKKACYPVGFQELEASKISRKSAHDGGKAVSPK
jgi:hypothetical protein